MTLEPSSPSLTPLPCPSSQVSRLCLPGSAWGSSQENVAQAELGGVEIKFCFLEHGCEVGPERIRAWGTLRLGVFTLQGQRSV